MEIVSQCRMKIINGVVALKPVNPCELKAFEKLVKSDETVVIAHLETPDRLKSYSQVKTVWKLVEIIWQTQNRNIDGTFPIPTRQQRENMYADLKEAFCDKRRSLIEPDKLVPIGLSEQTVEQATRFIQSLINLLYDIADFTIYDTVMINEVKQVINKWHEWRGNLADDPLDNVTAEEWRESHTVSDASGIGGDIEIAHIVSRGADASDIDKPWNWIALTHEEHARQHQYGWEEFIKSYPHLLPRIKRAREKAKKLERYCIIPEYDIF